MLYGSVYDLGHDGTENNGRTLQNYYSYAHKRMWSMLECCVKGLYGTEIDYYTEGTETNFYQ